ncbi:MAG: manganese catalase family protein [Clostridia bacterium]|nr:manganese catalase family protein [Clostridia bacterium]
MWIYEKRLEYPVSITRPDVRMAKLLMAQYGGPDSDVCANKRNLSDRAEISDKNEEKPCKMEPLAYDPRLLESRIKRAIDGYKRGTEPK